MTKRRKVVPKGLMSVLRAPNTGQNAKDPGVGTRIPPSMNSSIPFDRGDARQRVELAGSGLSDASSHETWFPDGGSSRLAMASRKRRITLGWVRKAICCILLEHLGTEGRRSRTPSGAIAPTGFCGHTGSFLCRWSERSRRAKAWELEVWAPPWAAALNGERIRRSSEPRAAWAAERAPRGTIQPERPQRKITVIGARLAEVSPLRELPSLLGFQRAPECLGNLLRTSNLHVVLSNSVLKNRKTRVIWT